MSSQHDLATALDAYRVHADVRDVITSVAARHPLAVDEPGDGSLALRSAIGGLAAAIVHSDQLYLGLDPSLVRQVRDSIGWAVTGRSSYHVTIRAEDLLGPAAQELAVSLLDQAVVTAATAPPPPEPVARRAAAPRTTRVPGTRAAAAKAAPVVVPEPVKDICPRCFCERLGGHCANCD